MDKLFSNISSRSSCEIKKRKRECDHDYSYYENSSQPLTTSEHQNLSSNSDVPSSPTTQEEDAESVHEEDKLLDDSEPSDDSQDCF